MPDTPPDTIPKPVSHTTKTRPWLVCIALTALYTLTVGAAIFTNTADERSRYDQNRYHEPVIRGFIQDWPTPNVADYASATTPGYHLAIAAAARHLDERLRTLQLLGASFGLALVLLVGWWAGSRAPPLHALGLGAMLCCSTYIWSSGVTLLPDNAGWLGVAAVLALCLAPRVTTTTLIAAGFVLALLVLMRQSHLWAAAPIWLAAWLRADNPRPQHEPGRATDPDRDELPTLRADLAFLIAPTRARLIQAAIALVCTLPAFALVAWFVNMWGGLTPPMFHETTDGQIGHQGPNPAGPALVLAIFGAASLAATGYLLPTLTAALRTRKACLLLAIAAGLAIAIIIPTAYDRDAGRWGGAIWEVARRLPAPLDRSPIIIACSALGALACALWWLALGTRERWTMLAALGAFTAAQTANLQQWQRYIEPMALILIALLASTLPPAKTTLQSRLRLALPLLAALAFLALTAIKLR